MVSLEEVVIDDVPLWLQEVPPPTRAKKPVKDLHEPEAEKRIKKPPVALVVAAGAMAVAAGWSNSNDITARVYEGGRSSWKSETTLRVAGTRTPLSWQFWNKAKPQNESYVITTDKNIKSVPNSQVIHVERSYDAYFIAASTIQRMDAISHVEGEFNKLVPALEGMDGKLGTAFNGNHMAFSQDEKEDAVRSLNIAGRETIKIEQKWNGVQVTPDWIKDKYYDIDLNYRNWRTEKVMNLQIAWESVEKNVDSAIYSSRVKLARIITPASPSPQGSGS